MASKDFRLSEQFLNKYKDKKPPFGFNGLGEFIYKRTYSRIRDNGTNEEWWETVQRVVEGCYRLQKEHIEMYNLGWNGQQAQYSAQQMYDRIFNMKFLPPGRGLWAMGTDIIDEKGLNIALFNCAFVSTADIKDDPAKPFCFMMDLSMTGCGIGYDTVGAGSVIIKGPNNNRNVEQYIVPDTREGWVESLRLQLESYFYGTAPITFDYSQIRPAGTPLKTFGGICAGSQPLEDLHNYLANHLDPCIGHPISITNIADIMNRIGQAVVAGNVRRSSQIIIGPHDSQEYIDLKNYEINPDRSTYGWTSNNSINAKRAMDYSEVAKRIRYNGEPGIVWLDNARNYGRMHNGPDYKDQRVMGMNPCSEINLENGETCNLVECFPNRHDDKEDFLKTLKYAYLYAKTVTLVKTQWSDTNRVMLRNRRIGTSVSGIQQFIASRGLDTLREWLEDGYHKLHELDDQYSNWLAIPKSIRISTVKPSGCQVGSTLINTMDGIYKLEELGDIFGDEWQDIDSSTTLDQKITQFYINGKVPTKIISTQDGNILECSLQHKYRILENDQIIWKSASALQLGDKLICQMADYNKTTEPELQEVSPPYCNCKKIKQPLSMSPKLAWLIGLMNGDGSVHSKSIRISFNRKEASLVNSIRDVVKDLFSIDIQVDNDHSIYINSTWLLKYLRCNGLLKELCSDIQIPLAIRLSSRDSILAFITGIWRADGGIHNNSTWSICTISQAMALQLLALCRSVGINAKIKNAGPGGWGSNDRWILSTRSVGDHNDRYRSRELIDRNIGDGLWIDSIVDIQDNMNYTYDISVPSANEYVANGVISHNSVSLLAGATSGIHFPESRYWIKRVRIMHNSPLLKPLKKAGYHIEPDAMDPDGTMVVEFPVDSGEGLRSVKDVSVWEKAAMAAFMQKYWADNAVSTTVDFDPETEGDQIEYILEHFQDKLKTISFLPRIDGGAYKQMPQEAITEEQYYIMVKKLKPINFAEIEGHDVFAENGCTTDYCEIKEAIQK